MILTNAQRRALRWLSEHGGSAVIAAETWLRLVAAGMVRGTGAGLVLTGEGWSVLAARAAA